MKKILLLLAAFIFCSLNADAQWSNGYNFSRMFFIDAVGMDYNGDGEFNDGETSKVSPDSCFVFVRYRSFGDGRNVMNVIMRVSNDNSDTVYSCDLFHAKLEKIEIKGSIYYLVVDSNGEWVFWVLRSNDGHRMVAVLKPELFVKVTN